MQSESSIVSDDIRKAIQAFSGRLAHDFNNLLTPLLAYPEMIATSLPEGSPGLTLLNALETAANSAVKVNRRLSDLSGMMRSEKRLVNVAEVVDSVLSDIKTSPKAEGVAIDKSVKSEVNVFISQDALSLAIGELCENALQAFETGGTLSIHAHRQEYTSAFKTSGGMAPAGSYIVIAVKDDGAGMSADVLETALEPFTSGFGGGKRCGGGLGLSIVYCALRENGAYLSLESDEGKGTSASILIQDQVEVDTTVADAADTVGERLKRESSTMPRILVVDDEPSIVNLFKMILENYIQGALVEKAMNGVEALETFKSGRYDVIVMDLHMPVMDGQTAFIEIEAVCAERGWRMPSVVFCTGYAPRDAVKRAVSEGTRHLLLNKPVRSETLVEAVQTRLGPAS